MITPIDLKNPWMSMISTSELKVGRAFVWPLATGSIQKDKLLLGSGIFNNHVTTNNHPKKADTVKIDFEFEGDSYFYAYPFVSNKEVMGVQISNTCEVFSVIQDLRGFRKLQKEFKAEKCFPKNELTIIKGETDILVKLNGSSRSIHLDKQWRYLDLKLSLANQFLEYGKRIFINSVSWSQGTRHIRTDNFKANNLFSLNFTFGLIFLIVLAVLRFFLKAKFKDLLLFQSVILLLIATLWFVDGKMSLFDSHDPHKGVPLLSSFRAQHVLPKFIRGGLFQKKFLDLSGNDWRYFTIERMQEEGFSDYLQIGNYQRLPSNKLMTSFYLGCGSICMKRVNIDWSEYKPIKGDSLIIMGGSQTYGEGAVSLSRTWAASLAKKLLQANKFKSVYNVSQKGEALIHQLEILKNSPFLPKQILLNWSANEDGAEEAKKSFAKLIKYANEKKIKLLLIRESRSAQYLLTGIQESIRKAIFQIANDYDLEIYEVEKPLNQKVAHHLGWIDDVHLSGFGHDILADELELLFQK